MKEIFQKLKTWHGGLKFWKKYLLWSFVISILLVVFSPEPTPEQIKAQQKEDSLSVEYDKIENKKKEQRKNLIEAYLISKRIVREALKDPDSYEELDHAEHYINKTKKGATIEVVLEYTATNSFGGRIKSVQSIFFDDELNFISSKTY
jgi:hypothetical protein